MTKSKWPGAKVKQVVDVYDYSTWIARKQSDLEERALFKGIEQDSFVTDASSAAIIEDESRTVLPLSHIVIVKRTEKIEEES